MVDRPELGLRSPNSVLANALLRTIDLIRPKVMALRPKRIEFVVGTQINGAPHSGTSLVQATAFVLARLARRRFSLDSGVRFGALDNAPYDIVLDPETHHAYQQTYFHALGEGGVASLVAKYYQAFFDSLSDATDAEYTIQTYSQQQAEPLFRREFLATLDRLEAIRWWLAPSHGMVHIRIPCPDCGWAEKRAERTRLVGSDESGARFSAVCFDHGEYEAVVSPDNDTYLDLSTIYRNVIKERSVSAESDILPVMVKGGDWVFGCQLIDGVHAALGTIPESLPLRIYAPQVLAPTGAKLSKSLLRETEDSESPRPNDWMLDASTWPGSVDEYVDSLIWIIEELVEDPKDFFRSYTTDELGRLMSLRPDFRNRPRARSIAIYKRYFDLIAEGSKTIEVRVGYSSMKKITAGQLLRFTCRNEECLTRVKRVANYPSFEALFASEDAKTINPHQPPEEQMREIRSIFPPDKEALGVIAIEFVPV